MSDAKKKISLPELLGHKPGKDVMHEIAEDLIKHRKPAFQEFGYFLALYLRLEIPYPQKFISFERKKGGLKLKEGHEWLIDFMVEELEINWDTDHINPSVVKKFIKKRQLTDGLKKVLIRKFGRDKIHDTFTVTEITLKVKIVGTHTKLIRYLNLNLKEYSLDPKNILSIGQEVPPIVKVE